MDDDLSRGIHVENLNERWSNGPEFLQLPEEFCPQETLKPIPEVDMERRHVKIVCDVTKVEQAIDPKKFSSWRKLIRVTARIQRLKRRYACESMHRKEEMIHSMRAHKAETQLMVNLPAQRLAPYTPPFYITACDYFRPYHVKIARNKAAKHYGVMFTCLNTTAVHLEMAVDLSTMEFLQVLQRFLALRGQPAVMLSDNGSQFVSAGMPITHT